MILTRNYTFQHAKRTGIFPYWARFCFLYRNFVFGFICISVLPPGNDRYAFCRNCLLFYKCKMWLILERKQSSTIQGQNVLRCERNWRHQDKRTKRRLLQKIANVFFFFLSRTVAIHVNLLASAAGLEVNFLVHLQSSVSKICSTSKLVRPLNGFQMSGRHGWF